jgi:phosphate transport system permease protein
MVSSGFNWSFFVSGDSRERSLPACSAASSDRRDAPGDARDLPAGRVAAAIYLEEFASKNRFTELVEVNINNLARGALDRVRAVGIGDLPQLLRHAAVVGPGRRPRCWRCSSCRLSSSPARAALRAVPPSIREAARHRASHQQAVFHRAARHAGS